MPRGMLEFYADATLPYHREELEPDRRIILHCASGGRSALAADLLREMGYTNVAHMDGGLTAWKAAGRTVEQGG
jgi:rhodanese-related sulfurtransferase